MATTQQLLDEATAARHALITGSSSVLVQFGERKVEYTSASLRDLERYIAELRRSIAGVVKASRNRISYMVPD